MAKERKPKQIVLYVELEDNVGAILARRRVELPVTAEVDIDKVVETLTKSTQ